ncbi:TPA: GNAT family N-acetyltransferase [Escherichia coli]
MTEIITPRLIIRGFMKKDAEALYEYLKSPVTPCFYDERLNSLSEAEHEVLRRSRDQNQFAVCMRDNDVLIGHLFADNSNEPDNDNWAVGWHFKLALDRAFSYNGKQTAPVPARITGNVDALGELFASCGWLIQSSAEPEVLLLYSCALLTMCLHKI